MASSPLSEPAHEVVTSLLIASGFSATHHLEALSGGANNRVFRVRVADRSLLLKQYFTHPNDLRNRLEAEYSFARFAWQRGVREVPEPFGFDPVHQLGLYEFIEGRRLEADEIDRAKVQAAGRFVCEINLHNTDAEASALPQASEACFQWSEHLACVQRRVQALERLDGEEPIDREAGQFVRNTLLPAWQKISEKVRRKGQSLDRMTEKNRHKENKCLSPSDFGFHNAMLTPENRLRFFDFEYAGWDDPTKLICDFFCQVEVPVPLEWIEPFIRSLSLEPEVFRRTIEQVVLLLPVYRVKWCCIVMNEFLATSKQRRRFSRPDIDPTQKKAEQLAKAQQILSRLSESLSIVERELDMGK